MEKESLFMIGVNLMWRNVDRIINEIRAEGLLEGKAEGILEGTDLEKVNTIQRLYLMNANIDVIAYACGLDKEAVLKIIRERGLVYTG